MNDNSQYNATLDAGKDKDEVFFTLINEISAAVCRYLDIEAPDTSTLLSIITDEKNDAASVG